MHDLDMARADASASSGGGIGFLLAYALTLAVAGLLAFILPIEVAALVVLFQGGVALPLAFALERLFGFPPMHEANPLRPLVVEMAMVQIVALPAAIVVYALDPAYVPAAFAAIGGGHFLPYAWLHRTRLYLVLGVAVSLGSLAIMVAAGRAGFPYVPLYWAACYALAAVAIRRERSTGLPRARHAGGR